MKSTKRGAMESTERVGKGKYQGEEMESTGRENEMDYKLGHAGFSHNSSMDLCNYMQKHEVYVCIQNGKCMGDVNVKSVYRMTNVGMDGNVYGEREEGSKNMACIRRYRSPS